MCSGCPIGFEKVFLDDCLGLKTCRQSCDLTTMLMGSQAELLLMDQTTFSSRPGASAFRKTHTSLEFGSRETGDTIS